MSEMSLLVATPGRRANGASHLVFFESGREVRASCGLERREPIPPISPNPSPQPRFRAITLPSSDQEPSQAAAAPGRVSWLRCLEPPGLGRFPPVCRRGLRLDPSTRLRLRFRAARASRSRSGLGVPSKDPQSWWLVAGRHESPPRGCDLTQVLRATLENATGTCPGPHNGHTAR